MAQFFLIIGKIIKKEKHPFVYSIIKNFRQIPRIDHVKVYQIVMPIKNKIKKIIYAQFK